MLNVSSPNTPGLRDLESVARLRPLVEAVQQAVADKPLLVKISPDLSDEDVDAVADMALELGLAGIVATNTTRAAGGAAHTGRGGLEARLAGRRRGVRGAFEAALARGAATAARACGNQLVLISVGGVSTPDDVWERVLAGATLVQAYTGFVYGGPGWPRAVNLELARRTWDSGSRSIQELIGKHGARPEAINKLRESTKTSRRRRHAAGNGRTRAHGRQHGAAAGPLTGTSCVVYDVSADAVTALAQETAPPAPPRWRTWSPS